MTVVDDNVQTYDAASSANMRGRVVRGLGWVGASQIVMQLIRTSGAIVVARLLTPDEYGLAMLALVFVSLVLVFSDLALGAALVQRKSISERDRSTAFWITVGAGLLFSVVGFALSGPVADIYDQPTAQPLLAALSASFLLTALGATQQSLLLRDMQFGRIETINMVAALAGTASAVALALAGTGAWAIIAQQLATAAMASVLLWRASSWRPRLLFSKASARDLGGFSTYLVGHRLLYYIHQNADRLLVGRFIGTAALGAYAVAYNVILQPASRIAGPVQRVLTPAFSRMQDEPDRIAALWAKAGRLVGAIAIPSLGGLVVVAPDFVPVVLGSQWHAAVPVIQLLAWVGMVQAVQAINVDILIARDRTKWLFRYSVAFTTAHVTAFAIGLQWGIVGVAAAFAVSTTFIEPVLTVLCARALGVSPLVFVRALSGVVQATGAMCALLLGLRWALLEADVPAAARLFALVAVGAIVFIPLLMWRAPEVWQDVRALLGPRLGRFGRRSPVAAAEA
jgi:O-antigen/teichoic acid export membrane protein